MFTVMTYLVWVGLGLCALVYIASSITTTGRRIEVRLERLMDSTSSVNNELWKISAAQEKAYKAKLDEVLIRLSRFESGLIMLSTRMKRLEAPTPKEKAEAISELAIRELTGNQQ
jgi:hypothetical protein